MRPFARHSRRPFAALVAVVAMILAGAIVGSALGTTAPQASTGGAGVPTSSGPASTATTPTTPATTPTTPATTPTTPATTPTTPTAPPPVPTLYRPVRCVRRGPAVAYSEGSGGPRKKVVALSFDDGPAPITPAFVGMLEAQHAPATFFMIGDQVSAGYRNTLRRELRAGDALGDHTWTHPDLELLGSGEVRSQLQQTLQAIRSLTGYTPCVFRPPYGDYDQSIIDTASSLGLATILWNVDPSDYTLPGTSAIEQRVLAQARPGSIILSHDGGGPRGETLAAYPYIIRALRRRGYRFETVPQLLGFHTVYVRCVKQCMGEGVKAPLPPGSIVEKSGPAS